MYLLLIDYWRYHMKTKKIISCFTAFTLALSFLPFSHNLTENNISYATTIEQINQADVFLKQPPGSVTCTLVASAMLMRRVAYLRGDWDWYSITESSLMPTAWFSEGLYNSFSYKGINVTYKYVNRGDTDTLISMLNQHPEGIVVYNYDYPHAILLTDYTNGTFYCADPANGAPNGRIPVSQAIISIYAIDKVWYCSSPSVSPSPSVIKVNFNAGDGKSTSSQKDVKYGETYGDLPSATLNGYSFDGWYSSNGEWINSNSSVTINHDHTLSAHWKGNEYTVSFNSTGGECEKSSKKVIYNEQYGMLPVPNKENYTFTGWYTSIDGGEKVTNETSYKTLGDTILYAHWKDEVIAGGECGKSAKWEYDKSGTLTISGSGDMETDYFNIPWEDYRGGIKKVVIENGITSISEMAFTFCEELEEVTIPDSVTKIEFCAFQSCKKLKKIAFPASVQTYGGSILNCCSSLEEVSLPSNLKRISGGMFSSCENLKTVEIPASVTEIGSSAFAMCSIETINLPEGIMKIERGAFQGSKINSIELPETLTDIGEGAFAGCSNLKSIYIPKNVSNIGDIGTGKSVYGSAFYQSENLCEINVSPNNEYYSSQDGVLFSKDKSVLYAYPDGKKDKTYIIPDNVRIIEIGSFNFCKLEEITIPQGLEEIHQGAFSQSAELKSMSLPESVKKIEQWAFLGNENMQELKIENENCELKDNIGFDGCIYGYISSTAQQYTKKYKNNFMPLDLMLDETQIDLRNGDQYNILANQKDLFYKSNNNDVAIVSKKGLITAVGEGSALITVYNNNSETVQMTVNVLPVTPTTTASTTTTQKSTTTTTTSTTTTQKPTTTTTISTTTTQKPTTTTTTTTSMTTTQKPTTTTTTTTTTSTTTTQKPTTTTNKLDVLKNTTLTLTNGDQYVIPIDTSDLIFSSNNKEVAVVSNNGTITAIGTGEAIISVIDVESNVVQLKINVQPVTTSSVTTTTTSITTTTTITTTISQPVEYKLGDVNNNGTIDAVDASTVLAYYAMISTNKDGGFDNNQKVAADVDHDGKINAVDASNILSYYAYVSTTKDEVLPMEEFMKKNIKH